MYGNPNNSARVFEIQQSIASLKQAQDQPFIEHFEHFKQRLDELRQYRPTANSVQVYIKREEQDEIHNLLASLTPNFGEVRRDILLRPGPSCHLSTLFVLSFIMKKLEKDDGKRFQDNYFLSKF
jgi:hypothetical protein